MTSRLFTPLTLRSLTIPNRAWMSPMCQYSAATEGPLTGAPNDWHVQHYGSRALGGPGLILAEATAVTAEGRISPADLGIWNDAQIEGHRRLTAFMRAHGVAAGIQLAHAGRKAGTAAPFAGGAPLSDTEGGWTPLGPSAVAFNERHRAPRALSPGQIDAVIEAFAAASARSIEAGYQVIEVHAAHGYLLHSFLSPVSNRREDDYGGTFENRARLPLAVVEAVRETVGPHVPVLVRVSATDWIEPEGWTVDDTVRFAGLLRECGADLVDVSSGGSLRADIPVGPGYQAPFAARVRAEAGVPSAAVGMITEARQAEKLLADGDADAVFLGRELLREPYWPRKAARELGDEIPAPDQYARA